MSECIEYNNKINTSKSLNKNQYTVMKAIGKSMSLTVRPTRVVYQCDTDVLNRKSWCGS